MPRPLAVTNLKNTIMNKMKKSTFENFSFDKLRPVLVIFFAFLSFSLFSQTKKDMTYTVVQTDIEGQDAPQGYTENTYFWGSSFDYAVFEFSNILKANLNNKKEQQRLEIARQQSLAKLGIIKNQYSEYTNFPETITDGWHSAIATDNMNFCKDVKVLVKSNKIQKFVIDNYIPVNFMATREIKNAKNVITLKNFNGEQLNIVEVYFLYDMEEPLLVQEPIKPGYICFWSDIKNFADIKLKFDNVRMEPFTVRFDSEPNCFSNGMVCRILKPGTYSFSAEGKGAIDWKGTIEIKENMCLKVRLGR